MVQQVARQSWSSTFDDMESLIVRFRELRQETAGWLARADEILSVFITSDHHRFVDYYNRETDRPHTVTTARALISLSSNPWLVTHRGKFPDNEDCLHTFSMAKRDGDYWSSDPAVVPNVFETAQIVLALQMAGIGGDEDLTRHKQLLKQYISNYNPTSVLKPSSDIDYCHPFFLFLAVKALRATDSFDDSVKEKAEVAFQVEVAAQLSFVQSQDPFRFDPIRLGLGAVGLLHLGNLWNPAILHRAINLFLEGQLSSGIWSQRNVVRLGNSFVGCSSLEILLEIARHPEINWLETHVERIERLFHWLKSQDVSDTAIPRWRADTSPHVACWFNALVLDLLAALDHALTLAIKTNALRQLPRPRSQSALNWSRLVDSGFKTAIDQRILEPIRSGRLLDAARSVILFGPPGTAKTTIARSFAQEVGWPLVELSAGDFCTQGISNVIARASELFNPNYARVGKKQGQKLQQNEIST